ncbi:MAG: phospholipid carrier-dependent glycosyltransferase [Anaerolineales bacterium]|nr:phospholipid carrier-dependent glycosyltransferase [Anaerolineales bacterium]
MQNKINMFFSRREFLLPLTLFVLFLVASLPGIQWGAPALWNPDELVWRVDMALNGAMQFDVTEPDYNYPSLPKYVMYAIGSITYGTGRSSFAFIVAARCFSAFLGAIAGVLIYYLARKIGARKRIAFLAGLLYIASGAAAENGRFAHNDMYLLVFTILSAFFVVHYQKTLSLRWLYLSFLMVGLAASCKYTGGSLIILPVIVYLAANWKSIKTQWLSMIGKLIAGGVISYLGYGFGTPRALISPVDYFSSVFPALRNLTNYGFNTGTPLGLIGQWPVLKETVGIFCYYIFLAGIVWFALRWLLWIFGRTTFANGLGSTIGAFLLILLIFDLPFMISINYIGRYFIPFIPFMAILSSLMIDEVLRLTSDRKLVFVHPVLITLLVLGLGYSALRIVSISLLFLNDSRIPATEYIASIRGYQKSIEYTLYPPMVEKRRFERAHNYPIYFIEWEGDEVPTGGRFEYNQAEKGLLERDTDYFVIDSFTYGRFYSDTICATTPGECDFFKRLIAGEVESFRLLREFTYRLPPYLPQVSLTAVNPDILIFERVR